MNRHLESAIERAETYLAAGEPIPLDLFAELNDLGVNVDALERKHNG